MVEKISIYGDTKSVDEIARKIDPTVNTFNCTCISSLPPHQTSTHKLNCGWCRGYTWVDLFCELDSDGNLKVIASDDHMHSDRNQIYSRTIEQIL